jgi:hypothetical protein
MKKSDISNSIKLTLENNLTSKIDQQTSLDPKLNITNITSSVKHSSSSPTTEKGDFKQHGERKSRPISDTTTQKTASSQFSGRV